MKAALVSAIASLLFAIGAAGAQEPPKLHDHEHAQPPAVAGEKHDENATAKQKEMCACCKKDDEMSGMKEKMDKMKDKMADMKKDGKS